MKKQLSLLLLIFLLLFTFTACSSGESDDADVTIDDTVDTSSMTAEELLQTSSEKLEAIDSYEMDLTMDMIMSAAGQDMTMHMVSDMTIFNAPVKMKMIMTTEMEIAGQTTSTPMEFYIVEEDENYVMHMSSGDTWIKQSISKDEFEQYDNTENMLLYMDSGVDMEITGTETINGEEAIIIEGTIDLSKMDEILAATGALDSLGTGSDIDTSGLDLGVMPITVWISAETAYPLGYQMDMSELMTGIMAALYSSEEMAGLELDFSVEEYLIDCTLANINNATDFDIPE